MNYLILLASGDPTGGTLDWIMGRGIPGLCLVLLIILGYVVNKLYKDNSDLRDRIEKALTDQKEEVKSLAQETTAKVEGLMLKQVLLVEKVVETQADTNATLRSLRIVDRN